MHYTQSRLFLSKLKLCPQSFKIIGGGVGQLGVRSAIGFATHGIGLFEFKPSEMVVLYVVHFHIHAPINHRASETILMAVTSVRPVISIVLVDCSLSDSGAGVRDGRFSLFDWFIINIFIG